MRQKISTIQVLFFGFLIFTLCSCAQTRDDDTLFQVSTISALSQGMYDGDMTFQELDKHGNFGLGTFNDLDGEMIGIDGIFYQARTDGFLYPVSLLKTKTPFSEVTFFKSDLTRMLDHPMTLFELKQLIDSFLRSKNIFYAIKVTGNFSYAKLRSVPAQKKPYPKLDDVVKNQSVFEFQQIEGTLIGFWCPEYVKKINVPGYHFHFISKDKKRGGHVLDCTVINAKIEIDEKEAFDIVLPSTKDFYMIDTSEESQNLAEK